MPARHVLLSLVAVAVLGAIAWILFGSGGDDPVPTPDGGSGIARGDAEGRQTAIGDPLTIADGLEAANAGRAALPAGSLGKPTGLRGIVYDESGRVPMAGVEVRAMREPPGLERLISRFRGSFFEGNGFWTGNSRPPRVLSTALTGPNGGFELLDVDPGLVFVDARADYAYVRSPVQVRVARGEVREGVELFASPAGRIRGLVRDSEGRPQDSVVVSVRPGLNAFLGQLTQRRFGWVEGLTDGEGRFDLYGVPPGTGYALSAAGPQMALEERYGIDVREGQVVDVDIIGHPGAFIAGQVLDPMGEPCGGANVAMVYLDVSRVLFSADGRAEPIVTNAEGRFLIDHVAAGRIGFIAATDGYAASEIVDLTVVDGGRYEDLAFTLGDGRTVTGIVVDDEDRPVAGATVEIRPFERPNDPDVLKLALKVRNVVSETKADGVFVARGIDSERVFLQASKPGYVTEVRFNVKIDGEQRIVLTRGVTVRGRVVGPDDKPLGRFRVDTRSRPVRADDAVANAAGGTDPAGTDPASQDDQQRGPPWARGGRNRNRDGGFRMSAGQRMGDQGMGGNWTDVLDVDGRFELRGVPPGNIRVRVRADGYRDPESQEVELVAGAESEDLLFIAEIGAVARGIVVEAGSLTPVAGADVTAYRARDESEGGRGGGMFQVNFAPEDFDFLGMTQGSQRTARADSQGRFEINGLSGGKYRFTARHPDLAKASSKELEIAVDQPTEGITIELDSGGTIVGRVTGAGRVPLRDALVVAASIQAGAFKSASTDDTGSYRIEGLTPGQYIVFKSRIDERAQNIGYDLLGNMRLKTVTVRRGGETRLDIQDESEGSVRVFGTVRDNGEPVKRAMVTALGTDREGLFGMGIRAQPTDEKGNYELVGLTPGSYFFQVTRFAGRPQQANLSVDVPEGMRDLRVDLDLPQSYIAGRVIDAQGNPVPRIQVSAGVIDSEAEEAPGLLGLIMKNSVTQARTDADGAFKLSSVAAGRYRIVASGRRLDRGGGRGNESAQYGEGSLEDIVVDGFAPIDNLVITLPRAGIVRGSVIDGNGSPVPGAELVASRADAPSNLGAEAQLMDLFGVQARPMRSDGDGKFEITGLTPGTYRVRADADGLAPGVAEDVVIRPDSTVDVTITVIRGATLRLRAQNADGSKIPLGYITVLDGQGKPLASRVSTMSILRRAFSGGISKVEDTGWHEIGGVPPDTYTVIVAEPGKPELRFTRTIQDGEVVEWDVDITAELEAAGRGK